LACTGRPVNPEDYTEIISRELKEEKKITSKALANFPTMLEISTIAVSILLLLLRARVLLSPLFLLSVDKGRFSETRLVLGPCMIKEIEGTLCPIYDVCLGGQY
jgi:hypothetical protein